MPKSVRAPKKSKTKKNKKSKTNIYIDQHPKVTNRKDYIVGIIANYSELAWEVSALAWEGLPLAWKYPIRPWADFQHVCWQKMPSAACHFPSDRIWQKHRLDGSCGGQGKRKKQSEPPPRPAANQRKRFVLKNVSAGFSKTEPRFRKQF